MPELAKNAKRPAVDLLTLGVKCLEKLAKFIRTLESIPEGHGTMMDNTQLGAYKITPEGATHVWTLPDQPHFLIPTQSDSVARPRVVIRDGLVCHTTGGPDNQNDRRFIVANLATGEVLVNELRENDSWFQLIEDKLLYCRD